MNNTISNSVMLLLSSSFEAPWTVAYQSPLSMGFPRQKHRSGLPFPSLGHLPDPGIKPRSPVLQADSLPSELPGKPMQDRKGLKLEGEGGRLGKVRCWSREQHQLCFFPWKHRGACKPLRLLQGL